MSRCPLLISWGEQHVSGGLASILTIRAALAFAIAALTGHAVRGASQGFGLVCGFAGVILIIGAEALKELGGPQLASQLALVGAASSNYGRVFRSVSPIAVGAGTLLCASALTVPLSLALDRPWTVEPSAESTGALVLLGLLSTALAFSIYFRLLGTLGTVGTCAGCS
jgi:drug/metabolite transporter (DMT)-like permease